MTDQPIDADGRAATRPLDRIAIRASVREPSFVGEGPRGASTSAVRVAPATDIRDAIHRHRNGITEPRGPLVVLGAERSRLAAALVELGEEVIELETNDLEQSRAGGGHDIVIVGGTETERQTAVKAAYALLRPGGLLLLSVAGDVKTRRGRGDRVRSARDTASTLLFAEGFERPRFRSFDGQLLVEGVRSAKAPPAERPQVLSVVMPVFNEQSTFREVIEGLVAKKIDDLEIEIVVVESNSTDGTREQVLEYANHPRVRVVLEDRAKGKGHAVRAGLAQAIGDFVLIQDADLEYDLDDYEPLLAPLRNLESSFVLGTRVRTTGARFGVRHFEKQVLVGRLMNVGNAVFLGLFNLVYGERLHDPFTMYKVMRRDCLHGMRLECDRFDFDWELTAKLLRAGYGPVEIPVRYQSRSFDEGKKISILGDPFSWIVACFRYRFADFEE